MVAPVADVFFSTIVVVCTVFTVSFFVEDKVSLLLVEVACVVLSLVATFVEIGFLEFGAVVDPSVAIEKFRSDFDIGVSADPFVVVDCVDVGLFDKAVNGCVVFISTFCVVFPRVSGAEVVLFTVEFALTGTTAVELTLFKDVAFCITVPFAELVPFPALEAVVKLEVELDVAGDLVALITAEALLTQAIDKFPVVDILQCDVKFTSVPLQIAKGAVLFVEQISVKLR